MVWEISEKYSPLFCCTALFSSHSLTLTDSYFWRFPRYISCWFLEKSFPRFIWKTPWIYFSFDSLRGFFPFFICSFKKTTYSDESHRCECGFWIGPSRISRCFFLFPDERSSDLVSRSNHIDTRESKLSSWISADPLSARHISEKTWEIYRLYTLTACSFYYKEHHRDLASLSVFSLHFSLKICLLKEYLSDISCFFWISCLFLASAWKMAFPHKSVYLDERSSLRDGHSSMYHFFWILTR